MINGCKLGNVDIIFSGSEATIYVYNGEEEDYSNLEKRLEKTQKKSYYYR